MRKLKRIQSDVDANGFPLCELKHQLVDSSEHTENEMMERSSVLCKKNRIFSFTCRCQRELFEKWHSSEDEGAKNEIIRKRRDCIFCLATSCLISRLR